MSKVFHYPVPRAKKSKVPKPQPLQRNAKAAEVIGTINGLKPDSKEEWWFAKALWNIGRSFDYQVRLAGGRDRSGGQILDFLVHTVPLYTPVFIQGKYWHSGQYGTTDPYKLARTDTLLRQNYGINATQPKEVSTKFMGSEEEVLSLVRSLFR